MLLVQGAILVFFMATQQMVLKSYIELRQRDDQDKHLQIFYFLPSTFKALKIDTKEFVLDGEMYDIKKIDSLKGLLKVTAQKDGFEKKVLSFIGALTDNNTSQSCFPTLIKKFLSLVYIIQHVGMLLYYDLMEGSIQSFFYNNLHLQDVFRELIKPPCLK
jgi:hypothetical protein